MLKAFPRPGARARLSGFVEKDNMGRNFAVLTNGIRRDSVKEHVNNILDKIGAANRTEAVAIALKKHLLKI